MTTQTPAPSGQSAKDKAAQVGDTAREQSAQVAGTAKEQALDVAHDAANQARDLIGELRQQLRQQTDTQRQRLGQLLDEFSDELENMADAGGRSGTATEVVRQAAQRLRSMRGYVEGGTDVGTDLRRFASRRPGAFILGAVAAGVLAGRATRGAAAVRSDQNQAGQGSRVIDVRGSATGAGTGYGDTRYGYADEADNTYGYDYGDGDVGSTTGSRFPSGTGYRQTDGERLAQTGYPDVTGYSETPIAHQVAGDLTQEYAVPSEPRTVTDADVEVGTDDDISRTRDPNLRPTTGGPAVSGQEWSGQERDR